MPTYNVLPLHRQSKELATTTKHTHNAWVVTFPGNEKTWVLKEMETPKKARAEKLAQEFFRAIIPYQPQTRIAVNRHNNTYYILSEEIKNYRKLPSKEHINFENGTYTGLGAVVLVAMFLQEVDFKNGNIGLDNENRVVKIDGDWCFGSLQDTELENLSFEISTYVLQNLPRAVNFYAHNWLDFIARPVFYRKSAIINLETISTSLQYINEMHQAILRVICTPNNFIYLLADSIFSSGSHEFTNLLNYRKSALLRAAMKMESFVAYIDSPEAYKEIEKLYLHLLHFETDSTPLIATTSQNNFFEHFTSTVGKLSPKLYCQFMISHIKKSHLKLRDYILLEQIQRLEKLLQDAMVAEDFREIKKEIDVLDAQLSSPAVKEYHQLQQKLRKQGRGSFFASAQLVAGLMEDMFFKTPLEERIDVSPSEWLSKVQKSRLVTANLILNKNLYESIDQINKKFNIVSEEGYKKTGGNIPWHSLM